MSKKNILGLLLFACLTTAGLFAGAQVLISQGSNAGVNQNQSYTADKDNSKNTDTDKSAGNSAAGDLTPGKTADIASNEPWLSSNPSDSGTGQGRDQSSVYDDGKTQGSSLDVSGSSSNSDGNNDNKAGTKTGDNDGKTTDVLNEGAKETQKLQLIIDSSQVDYKSHIPDMVKDAKLEADLDIDNPNISIDAKSAILFDADTKKVLYYKKPVTAMFPASTAKLLTSLVALDWCKTDEEITVGSEITMIAPDSTRAYMRKGETLTLGNLLKAMLLPSGNDAAYVTAAYVGRKSLKNPNASKEDAIHEFARLMNNKAKQLGVKNSNFMTPDGYDAIGQYTTAYDMGLIGIAAAQNKDILEVSKLSSARVTYKDGYEVTYTNTNKLISRYSGQYYSNAIGLKTGTSTMAGRCLIAAAKRNGKEVVCVIMDSSLEGRWQDAITLLRYGLK